MDYKLKGKKVFVSGSTSGIGLAIARLLVGEGAKVIINGRSHEHLDQALKEISATYPEADATGIMADFSDKNQVNRLVEQLQDIDILINNVGTFTSQSIQETTDDDWYRLFEVNVMSGIRLSKALLPEMIKNNWGRIVFISSECAMLVPPDLIAYSATKAAILAVSRGLAQITKGTNVTVNAILPGSTLSAGAEKFVKEQAEKQNVTAQEIANNFFTHERTTSIIGRFSTSEEIAAMAVFLSSPLSAATNGAAIKVDGGSIPGII